MSEFSLFWYLAGLSLGSVIGSAILVVILKYRSRR